MNNKNELLRRLPKIDALLLDSRVGQAAASLGENLVTACLRGAVDEARELILSGMPADASSDAIILRALEAAKRQSLPSLRPVVNATGVVLHTNLGRAVLAHEAAEAAFLAARGYSTLEYDCRTGQRGSRHTHVEGLLTRLTGAEAAMAVNNNAAAVMLILGAMARGMEVVVSRGELVEIGGSFRVPEIMEQSASRLREVGTTNRTHPADYERAIGDSTAALLKVHTSNYKITGFTGEVTLAQLAAIGRQHGIPVVYDMGSGAMISLEQFGLTGETTVPAALSDGADVVCFSGDKLLGGPQAGIIVGKKQYIDAMKKHPLARAFRLDKMTLAALEATLRIYSEPGQAAQKIPTYIMLSQSAEALKQRAENLASAIITSGLPPQARCAAAEDDGYVGGGSLPGQAVPTAAVAIWGVSPDALEEKLRLLDKPIIARISKDRLLLDMRTIDPADEKYVAEAVTSALKKGMIL